MKVAGIIAEYNPFHSGHAYHIQETRLRSGADRIIVIMSGPFVQRGEPAIAGKYMRALTALENGADLVIELPTAYACAGADDFAFGGISLLDRLGIVDVLSFGSESTCEEGLKRIAELLEEEPPEFGEVLRKALREGLSYPAAVSRAAASFLSEEESALLCRPNDLLALSYLRSLKRIGSSIEPLYIPRCGDYHEKQLTADGYSSATALRKEITAGNLSSLSGHIPEDEVRRFLNSSDFVGPLLADDFSLLLLSRIEQMDTATLAAIPDIGIDLANRIKAAAESAVSFSALVEKVKCKSVTQLHIQRALMRILLDIDRSLLDAARTDGPGYARILGFRKESTDLLSAIAEHSDLVRITRPADSEKLVSETDRRLYNLDRRSQELTRQTLQVKYRKEIQPEASIPLPILS